MLQINARVWWGSGGMGPEWRCIGGGSGQGREGKGNVRGRGMGGGG